jgi:hypothetical protein
MPVKVKLNINSQARGLVLVNVRHRESETENIASGTQLYVNEADGQIKEEISGIGLKNLGRGNFDKEAPV